MNPIAIVLLLVGYSLSLPVIGKIGTVVRKQNRLAMLGHQFGLLIAGLGWIVGGRPQLIWIHLLWAVAAIVWFNWVGTKGSAKKA